MGGVKQCPLMFMGKKPDPAISYECIEKKCAWWEGNGCSVRFISYYINALLKKPEKEEK